MNHQQVSSFIWLMVLFVVSLVPQELCADERVPDVIVDQPGVSLSLVAEHPDLATPTGIDVDASGRIWVVATHTHFRPDDYQGPEHDQILVFEDSDQDGTADQRQVFYESTDATMDLELGPDGWVYLAERDRIIRIKDNDGDGKADTEQTIASLDTEADYPHNGLESLAWHPDGDLVFGIGENFAKPWTLTGADSATVRGTGEGGIFRCTADGKQLRRIAIGFWNPFGICVRDDGEIFAAENDPGERPPCRLLHVIEGGDYGYQRAYGPEAHHPFVAWNGELRGTLPMIHPSGEAPCGVLPLGRGVLVPSWSDHRIDFFLLNQQGASYGAERIRLVQGSRYFRPACIASVGVQGGSTNKRTWYLTDWVDGRYQAHGYGRLWKLEIDLDAATWVGDLTPPQPTAKAQLAARLRGGRDEFETQELLELAQGEDPFLARSALIALARLATNWTPNEITSWPAARRVQAVLALKLAAVKPDQWAKTFIADEDPQVQFEALRWIADAGLTGLLPEVTEFIERSDLDYHRFEAAMATWNTLHGQPEAGIRNPELLLSRIRDDNSAANVRAYALRMLPSQPRTAPQDGSAPRRDLPGELTTELLGKLLAIDDEVLSVEVVRTLSMNAGKSQSLLLDVANDQRRSVGLRCEAIAGLAAVADQQIDALLILAGGENRKLREEALRSLRNIDLEPQHISAIKKLVQQYPESSDLIGAIVDPSSLTKERPQVEDTDAWLAALDNVAGPVDREAGRRIFHHARVTQCSNCHRHSGRGNVVGPDLSALNQTAGAKTEDKRKWLLQSILQPSLQMAPEYQPRTVLLNDGTVFTGIRLRSSTAEAMRDANGQNRSFNRDEIESMVESKVSFMPTGAADALTLRELRDLIAFLQDDPDQFHAVNTQKAGEHPPSAAAAAAMIQVPEGFNVSLFAGDPHVRQPIAFDFDDRGRLWVAECYTYEGSQYDLNKRDRILIFEDANGDGEFDSRKVFWDEGQRVTGLTVGFGGVWITSAPHLLFIADRDHNDVPDNKPQIKLDGFSILARHNMVNGLRWGPDGWLYGRHGITDSSTVGTPQTPVGKRTRLNCSIWRYHPTRDVFEVVTNGTTNPWGLDYDDHGQWFFTNNVINHLWHVVPGAHYQRMFGADFNPYVYDLIAPTADHFHWDTAGASGAATNVNRKQYDGRHDDHGGGHSHAGGMIYLGDNWPDEYRGTMLMCNTHGRRVNADQLVRDGNSYVARHCPDFLTAGNEWFRGVELKYGPDGGVFLTDWSDLGECHDRDGVHRTSGRIYKITYGMIAHQPVDLRQADNVELAKLQLHPNDWYVRHARRLLQEHAVAGADMSAARELLLQIYQTNNDVTRKLRAMWALCSIGAIDTAWLTEQLDAPDEHVRVWAVRLLVDHGSVSPATIARLTECCRREASPLVRLYLASALQRMNPQDRWELATTLAGYGEDADDRVQPLMLWYGIEAAVPTDPVRALQLAGASNIPLLRRHIARRLTEMIDQSPTWLASIIQQAADGDAEHTVDYLQGIVDALRGRRRVLAPETWTRVSKSLETHSDAAVAPLLRELSVVFGDGRAINELIEIASDADADAASRRDALQVVIDSQPQNLVAKLLKLKSDRVVGAQAIRGLARYEDPRVAKLLLASFAGARHDHRPAITETLAARPSYAAALLTAVADGRVQPRDISAASAAMIAQHGDEDLTEQLESLWGAVRATPKEKQQLIGNYRNLLSADNLAKADTLAGRQLFQKTCSNCHKMFGEGKSIGPELTGSNRDNLDYLLENIIDPSRIVPAQLRQSAILLVDGRIVTGTITSQNNETLSVQTATEELIVPVADVDTIRQTNTSLMPEGLLTGLVDDQIRDLIAYLQVSSQVPLNQ